MLTGTPGPDHGFRAATFGGGRHGRNETCFPETGTHYRPGADDMIATIYLRMLFGLAVLLPCAGCGLPWDPEGTFERVRNGTLRVGAVHNPPWVRLADGRKPEGVEVELVNLLAAELEAKVEWAPGGESALFTALERFELDLVVGGLPEDTPWKDRLGLTQVYFESPLGIGVPADAECPDGLDGREVAVVPGDVVAAALVRRRGGVPKGAGNPAIQKLPAAAERWRLAQWGYKWCDDVLETRRYVMAVPPGENRWLLTVDGFLHRQRAGVPLLLEGAAP